VFPDDVERLALLARLQVWFNLAVVVSLTGCAVLRLFGVTGLPLLSTYVLIGTSVTLASSAYFRANILRHDNGYMIPGTFLTMSTAVLADQVSGGVLMDFDLRLTATCVLVALLSLASLAVFGRRWR